ncbi:cyclopropane-fatty-acyl-phospholipid synthase family protein [Terrihabitans rhizophilus]|uniref:Cyclopropane-fatty-acyl-phospholipid synthase family protein n=1 Tax=Terrihabitans rhizophilus TaxID=3092662 RepID=A0ABU4RNL8_9HYPH|nr:cyclopropane-fatty-acyl-phospholipid synthase family protein [Terrihabitans sp. PJ23]MDX6805245.1 cyclopropane-fatty-acyl-phospholipid synthase family protein [Terrihabitans sp. PJ23]
MAMLLESMMRHAIRRGSLDVITHDGKRFRTGDGTGPDLAIRFTDAAAQRALLRNPDLALGELYMLGRLVVEDGSVADVLDLMLGNLHGRPYPAASRARARVRKLVRQWRQMNRGARSRRNVAHHYDLDRRLYDLFLDADRQYSCAYFEHPGQSLDDAQMAKKRHITAKLAVEPGHRVLDIGCGWGGLGLYLAEQAGADVTGITLSEEQLAIARGRAQERHLDRHVDFRLEDYRNTRGNFDRIVSVGMFEHVGVGFYETYFQQSARLLAPDGVMLMHTIGRIDGPGSNNPWVEKYIFPGGYIPAMSEITASIERSGLIVTDVEVLRLHYAETLKAWRERFMARREEAAALYDEAFVRMWEFYLAGSEASFRCGDIVVFQVQLAKRIETLPITRGYIAEREQDLRRREAVPLRLAGE